MHAHPVVPDEHMVAVGRQVHGGVQEFLCPLLALLDAQVDRRSFADAAAINAGDGWAFNAPDAARASETLGGFSGWVKCATRATRTSERQSRAAACLTPMNDLRDDPSAGWARSSLGAVYKAQTAT